MDWILIIALMFGALSILLLMGMPVTFSFLLVNAVGAYFVFGGEQGVIQAVRNSVNSMTSFVLVPIPLFILLGEILFQSGVAQRAITAVDRAISRVPARLSVVTAVGGTIFAALSGSSIANTALLGSTLLPEMTRRNYHPTLAMGPILASGAIAVLIPPSALAVLLGSLAKISIADLLVAGIVPAIMMAIGFLVVVIGAALLKPELAPKDQETVLSVSQRLMPLVTEVFPLSLILIAVVGSLLAGIATPTESAAFGCLSAVIITIIFRAFSLEVLFRALFETVRLSAVILFIVAASQTFSQILAFTGATQDFVALTSKFSDNPSAILLCIIIILLMLGCFVDQISMMMLTLPLVIPLAMQADINLVVLGTVYLLTMEIGLLTPPFGLLLFVMKGVAPPGIGMHNIYYAVAPFLLIKVVVLGLIFLFPSIVLWLPSLID